MSASPLDSWRDVERDVSPWLVESWDVVGLGPLTGYIREDDCMASAEELCVSATVRTMLDWKVDVWTDDNARACFAWCMQDQSL